VGMFATSSVARGISAVPGVTSARRDRVLIVEAEKESCGILRGYIEDKGYEVATAGTCALAEQVWPAIRPDVAILDYSLPDGNALGLIPRLKAIDASVPIIILAGYGSIDLAVEAIKLGAEHFLPKPAELPTLHVLVQRSLENRRDRRQQTAKKAMCDRAVSNPFLGKSDSIRRLAELASRVALSDAPVLIQGETGTGKGTVANWLHENGPRESEPFVDVNRGDFSRDLDVELFGDDQDDPGATSQSKAGLLEIAHKGTLFLEAIENVDFQVQSKLLKVVDEKQFRRLGEVFDLRVDVRLIAATEQVITPSALRKQFHGGLYQRISWIPLSIPPLRERVEDIPILSAHILGELTPDSGARDLELGRAVLRALQGYSWPGNLRELRNVLERVVLVTGKDASGDQNSRLDLQIEQYLSGIGHFRTLEEVERNYIQQVLRKERGRVQSAAKKLGIPRSSLYHKLKQYKTDQSEPQSIS